MASKKTQIYIFIGAMVNALLMIVLTLFSLSQAYTLDDEVLLIKLTSGFKNLILKVHEKPPRERFLFISVTWEKQFIDKLDKNGFPIGNDVITNRQSLGELLHTLNRNPDNHKLAILDVFFVDSSANDSLLKAELERVKNCVVSMHKKENGLADSSRFKTPNPGLSDMETNNDMVLKYHLVQGNNLKTTPLRMYEMIYNTKLEDLGLYDKLDGHYILNAFILDYAVRRYDLLEAPDDQRYPMIYLSEFLTLPPELQDEFTKDKIIIIGDFEGADKHETIYGDMPGPLILLNAFLALESGDNRISPLFILLLFISFSIISIKVIWVRDPITLYLEKRFGGQSLVIEMFADTMFYMLYFASVSVVSYFSFGIHLAILFLAMYVYGLETLIGFVEKRFRISSKTSDEELVK